nr:immunoglobulin heavy chain junction region [Mus musculus]MBK4186474.1 immunoglobulin heavy chain junction region [Mus musculus]
CARNDWGYFDYW